MRRTGRWVLVLTEKERLVVVDALELAIHGDRGVGTPAQRRALIKARDEAVEEFK